MAIPSFIRTAYRRIFRPVDYEMLQHLDGIRSLLDLGCGRDSPVRQFPKRIRKTGVEAYKPALEESRRKGIHHQYVNADVRDIGKRFKEDSFDLVCAIDLLEHIGKEDGKRLLKDMERIARKRIIIFTPNGFVPQDAAGGNPYQVHKSGWKADELRRLGYDVIGVNGWKPLRGRGSQLRLRPHLFWQAVSDLTQLYTRSHPEHAHQLLCIKELRK